VPPFLTTAILSLAVDPFQEVRSVFRELDSSGNDIAYGGGGAGLLNLPDEDFESAIAEALCEFTFDELAEVLIRVLQSHRRLFAMLIPESGRIEIEGP